MKEAKRVKPIQIRITQEIQDLLNWFFTNTLLVEDYLLPIVSIAGYKGERYIIIFVAVLDIITGIWLT